MSQTIEVEVGDLHAGLHEQLSNAVGDEYDLQVRDEVEALIHETYQQIERAQDNASNIEQKADLGDDLDTDE